jgi:hypothetical protein
MQREAQESAQHTELLLELELGMIVDAHGNSHWRVADGARLFYNDCEPAAVPTRYVLCSQDRAISRDWAVRTTREQFDATIEEFDASHPPFWSRPGDFADLLDKRRSTPK